MTGDLDITDRALLDVLSTDARQPIAGIAARLGVARSTVQQRLGRLEARGVIAGYTIRRGPSAPIGLQARVSIVVDGRRADGVTEAVAAVPEVRTLLAVSGPIDLIADVESCDAQRLDEVIDRIGALPGVINTETVVVLAVKIER